MDSKAGYTDSRQTDTHAYTHANIPRHVDWQ